MIITWPGLLKLQLFSGMSKKVTLEEIKIRTDFKPGDIGFMTYMHGVHYGFGIYFEIYVAQTLSSFYKNLDKTKERVWIAEHDDKIIGSLALKNTNGEAQLRYFLINPDYRGLGLGGKMLDLFMDFMKACGYRSSFLLTEEQLKTAAYLYEKYGYRYVSSSRMEFGLIELRYEMRLQ